MFSATKVVVAGAIVALFGGFLLTGFLTQQPSDEPLPPAAASASATAQAEPTDAATTEPEPTTEAEADDTATTADLLPGVDLVTEEVEPGVYRVLSDGVRDLVADWLTNRGVVAGQDGSIWLLRSNPDDGQTSVAFRLGEAGSISTDGRPGLLSDVEVGPDGVLWVEDYAPLGQRDHEPSLASFDGDGWTRHTPAEAVDGVSGVSVAPDGTVWAVMPTEELDHVVVARWDGEAWQRVGDELPSGSELPNDNYEGHRVTEIDDGDVWLLPRIMGSIYRDSGSGWERIDPPAGWTVIGGSVGHDGTLWTTLFREQQIDNIRSGALRLGRLDGETWQVLGSGGGTPAFAQILYAPAYFDVDDDGRVWMLDTATDDGCGGVVVFDGTSQVRLLDGLCTLVGDRTLDGNLWLEAGQLGGPIHTYVITPDAVAAAELEPVFSDPVGVFTNPDLLPGVDLVTEEVAPGVYRVLSDGIRDVGAIHDVAVTPAGDIWVELGEQRDWRVVRLGDPTVSRQFGRKRPWQLDVNADGSPTMDAAKYFVLDGEAWIKSERPERVVEASPDDCWGIVVDDECFFDYYGSIARLQDGEAQQLKDAEKAELGLTNQQGVGWIHHRHPSDGARWLMVLGPNGELEGLLGSGTSGPTWVPFPAEGGVGRVGSFDWLGKAVNRPQDASVWIPGVESDGLVITRWDGKAWSTYGPFRAPEPDPNGIRSAFRPDGSLWFTTGGRDASGALYVIAPEAVAQ